MVIMNIDDLSKLLDEESDISVDRISDGIVYLTYPPLDIHPDDIFFHDELFYLELRILIQYLTNEIFLSPIEVAYNKNGEVTHFIIKG